MFGQTNPQQRCRFYERHLRGETYQEIADSEGVSRECVRYWCRRQRDSGGCRTVYRRKPAGLLSRYHPLVRYCILRLRLEHPRWGPNRIREKLKRRPSLRGIALPSEANIGRYLHQWPKFRRSPKKKARRKRPGEATEVHQRWQVDFKMSIELEDGTLVNLLTVRDPVGEACLGASIFPAGKVSRKGKRVTFLQLRGGLRACFALWRTLPDEIQTDGEAIFAGKPQDSFPSRFKLWLVGLGIDHLVIRSGMPTDNSEVERCHRTVNDYAIVGNEDAHFTQLQYILDEAVHELAFELPSRAEGCGGLAPIVARPNCCNRVIRSKPGMSWRSST
jgi:transposase InsO family protein